MANIQQYLDNIANAEKGEDVRWSIHDGIEAINNEVVENTTASTNAVTQATAASTAAQQSAASAAESAEAANTAMEAVAEQTYFANVFASTKNLNRYIDYKKIGDVITEEQLTDIRSGNFEIVKLGSMIGPFIVVDINYFNTLSYPHILVMYNGIINTQSMCSDEAKFLQGETGLIVYLEQNYNNIMNIINSTFGSGAVKSLSHLGIGAISSDKKTAAGGVFNQPYWVPSMEELIGYRTDNVPYQCDDRFKQYSLFSLDTFAVSTNHTLATRNYSLRAADHTTLTGSFWALNNSYSSTSPRPILFSIPYSTACDKTIVCVIG